MDVGLSTFLVCFLFGVLSAKWSMELGYSQLMQIILFTTALFVGPLVLFILYIRLLYRRKENGEPGTQLFGHTKKIVS